MLCLELVSRTRLLMLYRHQNWVARLSPNWMMTYQKWWSHNSNTEMKKVNDYHGSNTKLLFIYQRCDDTVQTVSRALLEVAIIAHAPKTLMETEKTPTWNKFYKHRFQVVKSKLPPKPSGLSARCLRTTGTVFVNDKLQKTGNSRSKSKSHFGSTYYTCSIIRS